MFDPLKGDEPARTVKQYHFQSWPDKDVPETTWCLSHFWRDVSQAYKDTKYPIVVHCRYDQI